PPAACVELGARIKELGAAADALVDPVFEVVPETAGEGAFGGRLTGDLVIHGRELRAPLGIGLLDGIVAHDEQDTSMAWAQSGGKPACSSKPGCASNGRCNRP